MYEGGILTSEGGILTSEGGIKISEGAVLISDLWVQHTYWAWASMMHSRGGTYILDGQHYDSWEWQPVVYFGIEKGED